MDCVRQAGPGLHAQLPHLQRKGDVGFMRLQHLVHDGTRKK